MIRPPISLFQQQPLKTDDLPKFPQYAAPGMAAFGAHLLLALAQSRREEEETIALLLGDDDDGRNSG